MVKRAKTPPPPDDEPKYYTVYKPYPINANMERGEDRRVFSRWIASVMGESDSFFAIYHKPSAPAMIIVEVDYQFETRRLLGEHRWGEFLKTPENIDKNKVSQIFHSFYSSGRAVQKDGWLRLDVQAQWFYDWSNRDCDFVFPFPSSHYCDVPKEDKTNKPLCRPLPGSVIPPPLKAPKPVPGSSNWTGGKQTPSVKIPNARAEAPRQAPQTQATAPKPSPAPQAKKSPEQKTVPVGPPGRGLQPVPQTKNKAAWSKGTPAPKQAPGAPSAFPSLKASKGVPTPVQPPAWARSNDKVKEAARGGAMWAQHTGKGVVKDVDPDSWSSPAPSTDWGEPEPASGQDDNGWATAKSKEETPVSLWAQEYADDAIICPEHWDCPKLCKRGICSAYGEAKREKERRDRAIAAGKPPPDPSKASKKRSRGKGRGKGNNGTTSSVASDAASSASPSPSSKSDSRLGGMASPVSSVTSPLSSRPVSVADPSDHDSPPTTPSAEPGITLDDGESDDDVDPWF